MGEHQLGEFDVLVGAVVTGTGHHFHLLAKEKNKAGILKVERPERKPPSLVDRSLPEFEGIEIEFSAKQAKSKILLVCFWDMQQRPSRNCLRQLSTRAQELKAKGVVVVYLELLIYKSVL